MNTESIKEVKEHDFAGLRPDPQDFEQAESREHSSLGHDDTDSNTTATNTSDEFDRDEDEEINTHDHVKARRGRAVYRAFMLLSRPIRVLLVGALGTGILITPLLVFAVGHSRLFDSRIQHDPVAIRDQSGQVTGPCLVPLAYNYLGRCLRHISCGRRSSPSHHIYYHPFRWASRTS